MVFKVLRRSITKLTKLLSDKLRATGRDELAISERSVIVRTSVLLASMNIRNVPNVFGARNLNRFESRNGNETFDLAFDVLIFNFHTVR